MNNSLDVTNQGLLDTLGNQSVQFVLDFVYSIVTWISNFVTTNVEAVVILVILGLVISIIRKKGRRLM